MSHREAVAAAAGPLAARAMGYHGRALGAAPVVAGNAGGCSCFVSAGGSAGTPWLVSTAVCDALGIERPIVQAPLAVPRLTAGVSNACALGMVTLIWSEDAGPSFVRRRR